MAQQYLRPAAVKLGILVAEDRCRFGFHNLRHSLASYLVTQTKTDVKTVQSMLRHADVGTTLGLYTHAINKDKLVAQNQVMEAMRKPGAGELTRCTKQLCSDKCKDWLLL